MLQINARLSKQVSPINCFCLIGENISKHNILNLIREGFTKISLLKSSTTNMWGGGGGVGG